MRASSLVLALVLGGAASVALAESSGPGELDPSHEVPLSDSQQREMQSPAQTQGHPSESQASEQPNEQHNNQAHGPTSGGGADGAVSPDQPYRSAGSREDQ